VTSLLRHCGARALIKTACLHASLTGGCLPDCPTQLLLSCLPLPSCHACSPFLQVTEIGIRRLVPAVDFATASLI
jgi:hypothetical protein